MKDYTGTTLAIIVIRSLLKSYWIKPTYQEFISLLLNSANWNLRAAAYASLFDDVHIDESSTEDLSIFLKIATRDVAAAIHGMKTSSSFYLLENVNYDAQILMDSFYEKANIPENMKEYFDKELACVFNIYDRVEDVSGFVHKHNREIVKKLKDIELKQSGASNRLGKLFGFK